MKYRGVILKKLRELNHLSIKEAAIRLNRSVGWLSNIENQSGQCRITQQEYDRIFELYGGQNHQRLIHAWVSQANAENTKKTEINYDGAILKYLREKAGKTLDEVARTLSCSTCYLARVENGSLSISQIKRDSLIKIYGYSPESFKNFKLGNQRGQNVPAKFRLSILLKRMNETQINSIFVYAMNLLNSNKGE